MAKKQENTEEVIDLVAQYSKAETFIRENSKSLTIIVGAAILLGVLYFAYTRYYLAPRELEAQNQMFTAERYFEVDSLDLALNGDGNFPGFLGIVEEYSNTKSANLANYYAGIIYLKKGEFNSAIEYLKSYSGKDDLTPALALGALGDAYSELKDYKNAASSYKKAADKSSNNFTTPIFLMKYAQVCEELKDYSNALKAYNTIKIDFNESLQARDIDKYIARAESLK